MTSALARQLANIGSLDAARLQSSSSKSRDSFLFPARQAASLSTNDVHSLGLNGFLALAADDSRLAKFENQIFSEKAKTTDRTLLTKEEDEKLDRIIKSLLNHLASRFLVKNAAKVLEWLIRRFRVNEFNAEDLFRVILPYHETPQFAQMLQIIKLDDAKFQAFSAVKQALQPLPRLHLITAMRKSPDLLRFIATMIRPALADATIYPSLITFWTSSLVGYLDAIQRIDEGVMAILLPTLVDTLQARNEDVLLAGLIVLSRMVAKVQLASDAVELFMTCIVSRRTMDQSPETVEACITALIVLVESQSNSSDIPTKVLTAFIRTKHAQTALTELSKSYSASRLLQILFRSLAIAAEDDEAAATVLMDTLGFAGCPDQMVNTGLSSLIDCYITSETARPVILRVLNAMSQHSPQQYHAACAARLSDGNHETVASIKQLQSAVAGYGLFGMSRPDDTDIAVRLNSSEEEARAEALRQLLSACVNETTDEVSAVLCDKIVDRLRDHSVAVTAALFSQDGRQTLHKVAVQAPEAVYDACLYVISSSEAPRSSILARMAFLSNDFLLLHTAAGVSDWRHQILYEVIWPRIMATKANYKLWTGVWDILDECYCNFPLLAGCEGIPRGKGLEAARSFNDALTSQIAANIQQDETDAQDRVQQTVLDHLQDISEVAMSARILSGLLAERLVRVRPSVQFVHSILKLEYAGHHIVENLDDTSESQSMTHILDAAYSKSASGNTLTKLLTTLTSIAIVSLSIPPKQRCVWLANRRYDTPDQAISRAAALAVYHKLHQVGLSKKVTTAAWQNFIQRVVRSDSLAFFASIFTTEQAPLTLRLEALKDTLAYLEASRSAEGAKRDNDYQTILPFVLLALTSDDRSIREGALEIVHGILQSAKQVKQSQSAQRIYAFDGIYGHQASKGLQYLSVEQLCKYAQAIIDAKTQILLDPGHLKTVHTSDLEDKTAKKRLAVSDAVIQYIASHATACANLRASSTLLSLVAELGRPSVKLLAFLPMLKSSQSEHVLDTGHASVSQYAYNLASVLRNIPRSGLTADVFDTVVTILQSNTTNEYAVAVRNAVRAAISSAAFSHFSVQQQCDILAVLVRVGIAGNNEDMIDSKAALRRLQPEGETAALYLESLLVPLSQQDVHAKRAKAQQGHTTTLGTLKALTCFFENVTSDHLAPTSALLAVILDILAVIVEMQAALQPESPYIAQLLMNALGTVAIRAADQSVRVDDRVRISPVLEMLRVSQNQQSANQALNLIADLVYLAPEQVVQNIMPIFTFMGTNILHRDDAHSSRVVDKTIERLLPALIRYRRKRSANAASMVDELTDLLRLFVEAANHVPKHRRNRLFVHFVEVLGPRDFLAPVCQLLLDKVAVRYMKSKDIALLELPAGVMAAFPANMQTSALNHIMGEQIKRIDMLNVDGSDTSRASTPASTDSPALPVAISRRTILASLAFIASTFGNTAFISKFDQARTASSEDLEVELQHLVKLTLAVHTTTPNRLSEPDVLVLRSGCDQVVLHATRLLPTSMLADLVRGLLESNPLIQVAIGLLHSRLLNAKMLRRAELADVLIQAMECLRSRYTQSVGKAERSNVLRYMRMLAAHCEGSELTALSAAVRDVLNGLDKEEDLSVLAHAVSFAGESIPRMGARIIPHVSAIIKHSLHSIKVAIQATAVSLKIRRGAIAAAISALEAVVRGAPTFVTPQIPALLQLATDIDIIAFQEAGADDKISTVRTQLISAITKHIGSGLLFSAIHRHWLQIEQTTLAPMIATVDLLSKAIRTLGSSAIGEIYKTAFQTMLAMFDVRSKDSIATEDVVLLEKTVITSFMHMVLKLNEGTFRPLFLRLYDWATVETEPNTDPHFSRNTVLFSIMDRMLAQLKSIAIPYYTYLLDQVAGLLGHADAPPGLQRVIVTSLRRAFEHDENGFWTAPRLSKILPSLVFYTCHSTPSQALDIENRRAVLVAAALAAEEQENTLHALLRALLDATRSDLESTQLAAVDGLLSLWQSQSQAALAAYSAESMPFLVELLEVGGEVATTTKQLLQIMNADDVESSAGTSESDVDMDED